MSYTHFAADPFGTRPSRPAKKSKTQATKKIAVTKKTGAAKIGVKKSASKKPAPAKKIAAKKAAAKPTKAVTKPAKRSGAHEWHLEEVVILSRSPEKPRAVKKITKTAYVLVPNRWLCVNMCETSSFPEAWCLTHIPTGGAVFSAPCTDASRLKLMAAAEEVEKLTDWGSPKVVRQLEAMLTTGRGEGKELQAIRAKIPEIARKHGLRK